MLTKLSTFRGVDPRGEPLVRVFHQGDSIRKLAGCYQPEVQEFLCSYKSDLKKIALLVNAMGGSEYWGQNVNGDIFPWGALIHDCRVPNHSQHPYDAFYGKVIPPYGYPTFLDAHPFVHHKNKDPNRAFGNVVVSCLNKEMKRVELVVLIDRDRAAQFDAQSYVDRIDAGDFPDVSMGCRVPYDVCSICGHKSKTKDDYCTHVKDLGMNRILDDGRRVGVINIHPRFFDISFVFIGADRTAKVMTKLGSGGLWVPKSILDAEEVYGMASDDEGNMVKAASESILHKAHGGILSDVRDLQEPSGKRLLDELTPLERIKEQPIESDYFTDLIQDIFTTYLLDPKMDKVTANLKAKHDSPGYSDGVLRTNHADDNAVPDPDPKLAAFKEVLAGCGCPEDSGQSGPMSGDGLAYLAELKKGKTPEEADRAAGEKTALLKYVIPTIVGSVGGGLSGYNLQSKVPLPAGHPLYERQNQLSQQMQDLIEPDPVGDPNNEWSHQRDPAPENRERYNQILDELSQVQQQIQEAGKPTQKERVLAGLTGAGAGAASGVLSAHIAKSPLLASLAAPIGGIAAGNVAAQHFEDKKRKQLSEQQKTAEEKKLQAPPPRDEFPYQGKYKFKGLPVLVENKAGTWRVGKTWKTLMKNDYGEIEGSHGSDGDPVDVYIGPKESSDKVFIVHQNHAFGSKKGQYDEDKVMLGFGSSDEAKKAYQAHYDDPAFFRSITEMAFDQFKSLVFRKDMKGEKIAEKAEMEKEASIALEDLFASGANGTAVRRERLWKDKSTGKSTYHVGSGLGESFDSMQKTAAETTKVLDALFRTKDGGVKTGAELVQKWAAQIKDAARKFAQDKEADVIKEIDPDEATGHIVENLSKSEEALPPETLNAMGQKGVEKGLATPSMMGMVLRPEEFQRILLAAIGKTDLADKLDQEKKTFPVRSAGPSEAPCDSLGTGHFDPSLMQMLLPSLEGRSYLGPVIERRVTRVVLAPGKGTDYGTAESPLLSKVGAAYNWYRTEMLKVATHAPEIMREHPELYARALGSHDVDIFSKRANMNLPLDKNTVGAMLASIPLSLMYAASLRRDMEQGKDVGLLKRLLATHPYLTALGTGALVREMMKHPDVNRIVGNIAAEAMGAGQRIIGGA